MVREIEVHGETFPTKAALKARIRAIVGRYRDFEPLGPEDFAFMLALLGRHRHHAQKVGCGVASMEVRTNRPGRSRGFWLRRTDGTETDFSWVACVDPPGRRGDVMAACRAEVADQVLTFKDVNFAGRASLACPLTGEAVTRGNCHVDHVPPSTFGALLRRFLAEHGISIDEVGVSGFRDGRTEPGRLADRALASAWREYHRTHARLRLLSPRANLSLARRGVAR